ncbi:hypothetical protein B0H10DRAFT_1349965 [Mycena sp. CBHHK59/15]|nr:hypothetical protein B0H10DRAFT_1349965 [Mycena sp. CBHHK59/15]
MMEDSDSPIQNFPLITPTQWLDTPEVHRTSLAFDLASHALLRARAAVTEHAKAHSTKCEALVKERNDLLSQITVLQESLHHERAARKLEQEAIQMERAAFETWEKKLKEEENSIKSARASLSVDLTRTMQVIQEMATLHDLRPSVMSPPTGPSQCPDPPSPDTGLFGHDDRSTQSKRARPSGSPDPLDSVNLQTKDAGPVNLEERETKIRRLSSSTDVGQTIPNAHVRRTVEVVITQPMRGPTISPCRPLSITHPVHTPISTPTVIPSQTTTVQEPLPRGVFGLAIESCC